MEDKKPFFQIKSDHCSTEFNMGQWDALHKTNGISCKNCCEFSNESQFCRYFLVETYSNFFCAAFNPIMNG